MKLTIELDREVDGRWIAEVPELNVLRALFIVLNPLRVRSFLIGLLTANCLPIPPKPYLTSLHECLAVGQSAARPRRT